MKNAPFSANCRYCITIHQGALSRATVCVSKPFLFIIIKATVSAPCMSCRLVYLIASVMLYVFSLDKINGWMDGNFHKIDTYYYERYMSTV